MSPAVENISVEDKSNLVSHLAGGFKYCEGQRFNDYKVIKVGEGLIDLAVSGW